MSPEIPESPTCATEHGPESRSQTVRSDETHAPDLGPGQDNLDIDILDLASARGPHTQRHGGGAYRIPHRFHGMALTRCWQQQAAAGPRWGALNAKWLMRSMFLPSETGSGSMQRLEPEQAELLTYF
jgi:hypothetical protein